MSRFHLAPFLLRAAGTASLPIFQYHRVPVFAPKYILGEIEASEFARVLKNYLEWFRFLPLDEAIERLRCGSLPERAAAMTFDDGYADWFDHIVPLLRSHRVPATFFITTGQLGSNQPFWHERIAHSIAARTPGRLPPGVDFGLTEVGPHDADVAKAIRTVQEHLKYMSLAERDAAIAQLEQGVPRDGTFRPFTAMDVIQLRDAGFQIGGHSRRHPILTRCTTAEARDEIGGCKEELEAILREPVTQFAYPNGRPGVDFNAAHIDMVRQAGYRFAVTTGAGAARSDTDPLQVPRFTPWARSNWRSALQITHNMRVDAETLRAPSAGQQSVGSARRADKTPVDFSIPTSPVEPAKTVLMVAFHFPPQAGSSGILRTLNFAKYLPANGWSPIVLTAHPRAYEERRDDLLKSIPILTRVVRAFALDAARHLGYRRKYPSLFALPDRWSTWWLGGVISGLREIRTARPDVLWSTYPITTAHLIGATLCRLSGLPWVADFRDPMINGDYPSAPLQRKTWQRLEARVMRTATRCIFTTERAAEVYRDRYPAAAHKCIVIENGYDEEAFQGNVATREGVTADQLLLLHSGIIYPRDRDPSAFFRAVARLIDSRVMAREKVVIRFRAPYHGDEVAALARQFGLSDVVDVAPPISYREAIAEMMGADLLLVFQGSHFNSQIPAKIYEYLRTGRPVMGFVDPAGDTAEQLRKFDAVELPDIADTLAIATALEAWQTRRKDTNYMKACENNSHIVQRYSRVSHTRSLALVMNESSKLRR